MWITEVSIVSKATREIVWRLWTDVPHWRRWDDAIEASSIDGEFAVGAHGSLRPTEMAESLPFTLTAVEPLGAFTDVTDVPGATLEFWHRIAAIDGGLRLTHGARINGPDWGRYAHMLGERIAGGMCRAVAKLSELAEDESR